MQIICWFSALGPNGDEYKEMYKEEPNLIEEKQDALAPIDVAATMAERELTAFYTAVNEMFGNAEAAFAANEWIDEARSLDSPLGLQISDWRRVTIRASARLAQHLAPLTRRHVWICPWPRE